jgi:transposase InsO family protein
MGSSIIGEMVIDMNDAKLKTLPQLKAFLEGSTEVEFQPGGDDLARYEHIGAVLRRFDYGRLRRTDKGLVRCYLAHTTGYSRAQLTRLIERALAAAPLVKRYRGPARGFARRYTEADVALLAHTDTLHGTLSGPATKRLLVRAIEVYSDARYARLAQISVAHLYNLRAQAGYRRGRQRWDKTRSKAAAIGVRKAPQPQGRPGFIRIDSVHQGDQDGLKGLYHINAVDCVTQWQLVATCERLSEAYLLPVIEALLAAFPFRIEGFHADNGSEYINHQLAQMLDKLRVEFTRSRPRHCNDNALAETKNGAVVRKHLGYSHIPQRFAAELNAFCRDYLNPYLNFHRPCLFAEEVIDTKGKRRKRYPHASVMTPLEKLATLPALQRYLKPSITLSGLERQAASMSDNEAAQRLNQARAALFQSIHRRTKRSA